MDQLGGYILWFEKEYAEILQDTAKKQGELTETLHLILSKYKSVQLHCISIDNQNINYLSLVEQGKVHRKEAIDKSQLRFYNLLLIEPPILVQALSSIMDTELKVLSIKNTKENFNFWVGKNNWLRLIKEVKKLRPNLLNSINEMLEQVSESYYSKPIYNVIAQEKDIQRMTQAAKILLERKECQTKELLSCPGNYFSLLRLNENPFYFKLCNSTELSYSNQMIDGSYIHYEHLETLLNLDLGERGGKVVFQKDLQNSISNQLFVDLIKNGLIGSMGINNIQLNEIVEDLLNQGDSIILAESY